MALNLNRLNITPTKGLYVYMPNAPEPHNCIVSEAQATPLAAGDIVTLDATSTNTHCPVIKKAAVNDKVYGVIPFDAMKNSYNAKEKCMAAIEGSYIYLPAAKAITMGADLYFDATGAVTDTATAGNSIIGIANTAAAAKDDLVQVKLRFATTTAA
jgi:predicted RecA/RadA family phage recombinase